MRALEILSEEIPPLLHTDSGEKVMLWMDEFKVSHLPVLKHGNFVGVVSESAVLDHLNLESDLDHLFDHLPRPFVNQTPTSTTYSLKCLPRNFQCFRY